MLIGPNAQLQALTDQLLELSFRDPSPETLLQGLHTANNGVDLLTSYIHQRHLLLNTLVHQFEYALKKFCHGSFNQPVYPQLLTILARYEAFQQAIVYRQQELLHDIDDPEEETALEEPPSSTPFVLGVIAVFAFVYTVYIFAK